MGIVEGIEALLRRFGVRIENHEIAYTPMWMRIVSPLLSVLIIARSWHLRGVPGVVAALMVATVMTLGAVAGPRMTRWERRHRVLSVILAAVFIWSCGFLLAVYTVHLTDAECALVGAAVMCAGVGLRVKRDLLLR